MCIYPLDGPIQFPLSYSTKLMWTLQSDITKSAVQVLKLIIFMHLPFLFSLPTGCRVVCGCASALACVFGTLFMVDVALLGWSSLDTVQHTDG